MDHMVPGTGEPIARLLLAVVISDGDIDPDELSVVQRHIANLSGQRLSVASLQRAAEQMLEERASVRQCLAAMPPLDPVLAERIFIAAFEVASADGFVLEEEDSVLAQVAACLRMSEAQYRGTISALLETRAP